MLAKFRRLNLTKDFKWAAQGKKIDSKYAKLFIRMGDNKIPRIGIALSSKVFRKSTDRNRAKRILSSSFESLYLKLSENLNIVALPKQAILSVKSADVLLDLEERLKSEKIIS